MKKVMVNFEFPGMTSQKYDKVWEDMRKAGHANPKGLIHHAGAATDKGITVNDVWESAEHFNEFGKVLMPILAKNGVPPAEPVVLPVHYHYNAK